MAPIPIKHKMQRVGALAPLNMFNTMLRAPLLQYCEIGALSYERTPMAPYPIKCLMHEVGPLASQMLSMQVYLKGAPCCFIIVSYVPFHVK